MSGMAGRPSVTILHLSDIQFGKNHRFGRLALPPPDDAFDSLFVRLRDDLDRMCADQGLAPELIILSGDISEWGKTQELDDALELLDRLAAHLGLPRRRIVVIPGNHDVNRKSCEAYFAECESDDQKPLPPYWPKWRQYVAFLQKLYKDEPGLVFTPDQPWTLFRIDDLQVVVAGINSTMAESHLDGTHYGYAGEAQYRWFADQLRPFQRDGWLRIGVVHHNVQRGCVDDDENLRDADDLKRFLVPSLNLCLHGHTHEASLGWLAQHVPVLSTGSAAVIVKARAEEVPNQYQILRISASGFERFTRFFDPRAKKWMADPRGSANGNDWITRHAIPFAEVAATFAAEGEKPRRDEPGKERELGRERDDFLSRVAEVCRHRNPGATVTPVPLSDSSPAYLRVVERSESFVRTYPIGVFERGLDAGSLELYLRSVDASYRASDPTMSTEIVYGGTVLPAPEVLRAAEQRRVRVRSFVEYQGITDFGAYVRKQTATLEQDPIYPPSLYVPQRMHFVAAGAENATNDALEQVREWLLSPDPRFVLILGNFGTGKTFLLHELARRLGGDAHGPTPILVDLRALEKARTLDTLVAQHLAAAGMDRIDLAAFRYMLRQGRIVLLFDGFDELALRVSYDRAAEHLDTLLQAAAGDAKVVVTSRTQHFESDRQVRTVLYDRVQPVAGLRYCALQSFSEPQIRQFLLNRWEDPTVAEEWLELLDDVKDLLELSANPRMLGFITELGLETLRQARDRAGGAISAAKLYQLIIDRWLVFEYERAHMPGVEVTLSREARWAAVLAIANRLWRKTEKYLTPSELAEEVTNTLRKHQSNPPDASVASHLIGSGSLLCRDDEGSFFFVHQSVLEWLVARQATDELGAGGRAPVLGMAAMSLLMTDFFLDLATPAAARAWAEAILAEASLGESVLKANALQVLARTGGGAAVLSLAGQDLRGRDLGGLILRGADLRGADLSELRLPGKDLTGARLGGAKLIRAGLEGAVLVEASLEGADLSGASLLGADLRGARVRGGVWRRAKLIGARLDEGALAEVDAWAAALPGACTPAWRTASIPLPCLSLAWSPDGSVLASGHADGGIRLRDVRTGWEIRHLTGHAASVWSVAFSPDGQSLASAGDDKTVRLWSTASGQTIRELTGHAASVWSVAFSPDGQTLASAGDDKTVRLWSTASGQTIRELTGHAASVLSVAFSPDGQTLATAGDDKTVRLWSTASGQTIRELTGHAESVWSVAFSPDGQSLASAGADRTVRLWSTASGQTICELTGHAQYVRSVAFSPDGQSLASASADKTVRLWSTASGQTIRELIGHAASVRSVAFSPDGQSLASASDDKTVRLWSTASGQTIRELTGYANLVRSVAFGPDGQSLASAGDDKTVRLWSTASGQTIRELTGQAASVRSVAFSPDGQSLASASAVNTVRLWSTASGQTIREFTGHAASVRSVAFSPDGQSLASASADNTVRLWSTASGQTIRKLTGHAAAVWSVAFSPDGQSLASASNDKTVRLWSTASGQTIRELTGHAASVWSVAFSPDGQSLASASADQTVRLWSTASGQTIRELTGHAASVLSVAFSPDGQSLAGASDDKAVRLWSTASGQTIRELTGHAASVRSVAFSPDGRSLASASADNTVRLWSIATGELRLTLLATAEGWAAFTPDGRYKTAGNLAGGLWVALGLCRFEPGELDPYVPNLRALPPDEPF